MKKKLATFVFFIIAWTPVAFPFMVLGFLYQASSDAFEFGRGKFIECIDFVCK